MKLVGHLTETNNAEGPTSNAQRCNGKATPINREHATNVGVGNLFIFDEPTTGLHFDDVAMLLQLFQRLVDRGHSLVVIEHNLEVIKSADWIVDLGPEAGDDGGEIVAVGTPEEVAGTTNSHTGTFLRPVLSKFPKLLHVIPSRENGEGPRKSGRTLLKLSSVTIPKVRGSSLRSE